MVTSGQKAIVLKCGSQVIGRFTKSNIEKNIDSIESKPYKGKLNQKDITYYLAIIKIAKDEFKRQVS